MDIIEELHDYFQPTNCPDTESYREKRKELQALGDQVAESFGLDFWDRLTRLRNELDGDWDLAQFRAGFLLGASIMLEIFKSA